jgi:hypothetical protein
MLLKLCKGIPMKKTLISIYITTLFGGPVFGAESDDNLVQAAARNDKKALETMILAGKDVNEPHPLTLDGPFKVCKTKTIKDVTPVLAALANGHLELARWLISSENADPKYTTIDGGYQATHLAAFNGFPEPVMFLCLCYDMRLETKDSQGFDVRAAIGGGHLERMRACNAEIVAFTMYTLKDLADLVNIPLTEEQVQRVKHYGEDEIGLMHALDKCDHVGVKYCVQVGHDPFTTVIMGAYSPYSGYTAYTYAQKREDDFSVAYFNTLPKPEKTKI